MSNVGDFNGEIKMATHSSAVSGGLCPKRGDGKWETRVFQDNSLVTEAQWTFQLRPEDFRPSHRSEGADRTTQTHGKEAGETRAVSLPPHSPPH